MSDNLKTKQKVTSYLQAMSQRDLDATVSHFATVVDWNVPGNEKLAPWLGKRASQAEVRDFFKTLWNETVPLDASIDALMCEEDSAVVVGQFSSKMVRTGQVFDSPFSIHIKFSGPSIVYYRLLEDGYRLSHILG
jgi:ketosteroid isomerase-like protein